MLQEFAGQQDQTCLMSEPLQVAKPSYLLLQNELKKIAAKVTKSSQGYLVEAIRPANQ